MLSVNVNKISALLCIEITIGYSNFLSISMLANTNRRPRKKKNNRWLYLGICADFKDVLSI